jgi:hypothetical protein
LTAGFVELADTDVSGAVWMGLAFFGGPVPGKE